MVRPNSVKEKSRQSAVGSKTLSDRFHIRSEHCLESDLEELCPAAYAEPV